MKFCGLTEKNGVPLLWFDQGDYHAHNYKRADLPPDIVHALMEDARIKTSPEGAMYSDAPLRLTQEQFKTLVAYDPRRSRVEKLNDFSIDALKLAGETRTAWAESIGSDALSDYVMSAPLRNPISVEAAAKKIPLAELEKGFQAWLDAQQPEDAARSTPEAAASALNS